TRGQEINRSLGHQRGERYLERSRHHHAAALIRTARMNVHHIKAERDGVIEPSSSRAWPVFVHDVLLGDSAFGKHAARLAYVRILRESIVSVHDVGTKLDFGMSKLALNPVQERDRCAFCVLQNS